MDILYDYLYKDSLRLNSYYSQIWKGKLQTIEKGEATQENLRESGEGGLPVIKGSISHSEEFQNYSKLKYDPIDMATNDVLSYLMDNNYINKSYNEAKHGQLILAHGSLFFIDKYILEMTDPYFELLIKQLKSDNDSLELMLTFAKNFYSKIPFQTMFILKTKAGMLTGSVHESFLAENISSFYLKHSDNFLNDIYVIGIKESDHTQITLPDTSLPGIGQSVIREVSKLIYPVDAIRTTPIAMFRKLSPYK